MGLWFLAVLGAVSFVSIVACIPTLVSGSVSTTTLSTSPPAAVDPTGADGLNVRVVAQDRRVRWIELTSTSNSTTHRGEPDFQTRVDPGPYQLTVNVIGRPNATTTIDLDTSLDIQCEPGPEGHVVCSEEGQPSYTLTP
jgi:hypothetical protein